MKLWMILVQPHAQHRCALRYSLLAQDQAATQAAAPGEEEGGDA